jgi:hypothetical protein
MRMTELGLAPSFIVLPLERYRPKVARYPSFYIADQIFDDANVRARNVSI